VNYLIDTNAWLAFFEDSPILSNEAAEIMESGAVCLISIASVWEASIKIGLGKLKLPYDLRADLPRLLDENGFALLEIDMEDALAVVDLRRHHGDPFDRLMAVQGPCAATCGFSVATPSLRRTGCGAFGERSSAGQGAPLRTSPFNRT
jgi:PIN domain nuclease of toxin-antitoxin system